MVEDLTSRWPPAGTDTAPSAEAAGTPPALSAAELDRRLGAALSHPDVLEAIRKATRRHAPRRDWEDVEQETVVILMEAVRAKHDPGRGTVVAHILGKLCHAVMQANRRVCSARLPMPSRPGFRTLPMGPAALRVPDEGPAVDQLVSEKERIAALARVLGEVSPTHRRVLQVQLDPIYTDYQGDEYADLCGMSQRSWRRHNRRARRELARLLASHLDGRPTVLSAPGVAQ
jgi:DNA-directed RNA polymerase specialized sigma24 family protein